MIRRNAALLAAVLASLALAACSDVTGPNTAPKAEDSCKGITAGTGICVP
jgi:hypothetical protein